MTADHPVLPVESNGYLLIFMTFGGMENGMASLTPSFYAVDLMYENNYSECI